MTTLQVQHLLAYLGYDPGAMDGLDGPKTKLAVTAFQSDFGLSADGIAGTQTWEALRKAVGDDWKREEGGFWKEIAYFQREEFRCPCGKCGGFPREPEEKLVHLAEKVRLHFSLPVTISSGVRCAAHNERVGGVANSRHLMGKAVDFSVRGVSAERVLSYVKGLKNVRYAYGIDGSFVHMDVE